MSSATRASSSKSSTAASRKHSAIKEKDVLQKKKVGAGAIKKSFSGPSPAAKAAAAAFKKSYFRCQHDEMKAQFAKTGKLSDLPPPQPTDDPDDVKCPHCSHMLHNKPKSAAKAATGFWK